MYVKVEDEGDNGPPCAMPAPRKRSKLEHDHKVGQAAATLDQRTVDDHCAQVSSAAVAAVQQGVKPKPGSQEAEIVRFGKEKDTLQQPVDHLQRRVDVLQEAAAQAKAETTGLRTDVVRLTEENAQLQSKRDHAARLQERAVADATRLRQLVDRFGSDSHEGQQRHGQRQSWNGQPPRNAERDPLTNVQASAKELAVYRA